MPRPTISVARDSPRRGNASTEDESNRCLLHAPEGNYEMAIALVLRARRNASTKSSSPSYLESPASSSSSSSKSPLESSRLAYSKSKDKNDDKKDLIGGETNAGGGGSGWLGASRFASLPGKFTTAPAGSRGSSNASAIEPDKGSSRMLEDSALGTSSSFSSPHSSSPRSGHDSVLDDFEVLGQPTQPKDAKEEDKSSASAAFKAFDDKLALKETVPRERVKAAHLSAVRISASSTYENAAGAGRPLPAPQFVLNSDSALYMISTDEIDSRDTFREPSLKLASPPSCHAFRSNQSLEKASSAVPGLPESEDEAILAIGFSTGDILVYDMVKRVTVARLNKESCAHSGPVLDVCWVPASAQLAHKWGQTPLRQGETSQLLVSIGAVRPMVFLMDINVRDGAFSPDKHSKGQVVKVNSCFQGDTVHNPLLRIRLAPTPISQLAFSHRSRFVAMATAQGRIFVVDWQACLDAVPSRSSKILQTPHCVVAVCDGAFGGIYSLAWSFCDQLLVSGGEDDAISVWHIDDGGGAEDAEAARCPLIVTPLALGEAHMSFVSKVAFDPIVWSQSRAVRLLSAGHDGTLALWDLTQILASHNLRRRRERRMSTHSTPALSTAIGEVRSELGSFSVIHEARGSACAGVRRKFPAVAHERFSANAPRIDPLSIARGAHAEPIFDVLCLPDCLVSVCSASIAKIWTRPRLDDSDESGRKEFLPQVE